MFQLQMPVAKTYIFVEKTIEPVLSISGQALVSTDQHQVKLGAAMLPDVKITITQMRGVLLYTLAGFFLIKATAIDFLLTRKLAGFLCAIKGDLMRFPEARMEGEGRGS